MSATLYAIPASHPCACVELALRLKGIAYERVELLPVVHKLQQKARFGGSTVPGLVLDGRNHLGSRPIIRALETHTPEPRLLPADHKQCKSVELAEGWGDEVLQPMGRRLIWGALKRDPSAMESYTEGAELPVPDFMARLSAPLVAQASARANGAADTSVRADLLHLGHHLSRVERWIDHEVIGGEQPNAADLQIGSGLRLLLTLGDLAPIIDASPAGALARHWFPEYPGHVPAGTLPADWVPSPAQAASAA